LYIGAAGGARKSDDDEDADNCNDDADADDADTDADVDNNDIDGDDNDDDCNVPGLLDETGSIARPFFFD
jgi:hypothetical protein